jgi:RNA-binding protein
MAKEKKSLTGKQVRHLRALGHHLKPVVLVGKEGVSPSLIITIDECLSNHELLKIKLLETCPEDRREAALEIAKQTSSHVAQVLGRTILLYRKGETPEITLP